MPSGNVSETTAYSVRFWLQSEMPLPAIMEWRCNLAIILTFSFVNTLRLWQQLTLEYHEQRIHIIILYVVWSQYFPAFRIALIGIINPFKKWKN
jgi:hypothetical protein